MSKKHSSYFITIIFCTFIFTLPIASLLSPQQDFSELENRYLSTQPRITLKTILDGTYFNKLETYLTDHLAGRNIFVCTKALSEKMLGKEENNNVFFCKDDYLIKRVEKVDSKKNSNNIDYINKFVENTTANVYLGIIPTSACILNSKLPKFAQTEDEKSIINNIYKNVKATTLPILEKLDSKKEENIYYHTDIHLTSLGAYYVANSVFENTNKTQLDIKNYIANTVATNFYGSNYSYSLAFWVKPDSIQTYIPQENKQVTKYENGKSHNINLYNPEYLEKKDKYQYFLCGNQPLVVIKNEKVKDNSKILIIRDSYTSAIAPFISENYSEVHLIDLRYNKSSTLDYISKNKISDVVILYGFNTFATDKNIVFLNKTSQNNIS